MMPDKETIAQWLWVAIGSGLDMGLTVDQIVALFAQSDSIRKIAEIAAKDKP